MATAKNQPKPAHDKADEPSLEEREERVAKEPSRAHPIGQFFVKDGGQTVGEIAAQVMGSDTVENRHHLWDWNRNVLASPEARVPGGTILRIAEQGNASGGPALHELKNGALSNEDLRRSSPNIGEGGQTEADEARQETNRAVTRDLTPGTAGNTQGANVPAGSSGAEAQARQDSDKPAGEGSEGAGGGKGADADFA